MNQLCPSLQSRRGLDALNFLLADVRDGIGPYLAIFLLTTQHWEPARVGAAMSAMALASVLAQTPCGALIDATRCKRLSVAVAAILVGLGCVGLTVLTSFPVVLTIQAFTGIAAAIFPAAIAALTLGLVGPGQFAARMGRNEAFNHAGNVATAGLAGLAGYLFGIEAVFYLVGAMAVASLLSVWFIREEEINHAVARGAAPQAASGEAVSGVGTLLRNRALLIFACSTTLFHLANAAMLPLAGQVVALHYPEQASVAMSACIIAAQLVMVPIAAVAGVLAQRWGRKPVFLIAFLVLPVRGLLYTVTDDPWFVVAVQLLDGIGAGIFGVLGVTIVADLTQGSGRYNLALGATTTAQGIGAALSNLAAGYIAQGWGYTAGFLMLSGLAALALVVFSLAMPETREGDRPIFDSLRQYLPSSAPL
jgi:MFS family permease